MSGLILLSCFLIVCASGVLGLLHDLATCQDDFSVRPPDGLLERFTFGWLGFVRYVQKNDDQELHKSKAPRVVLVHKQFTIATASDMLHPPKGYKLGDAVFGEYEREETTCGITEAQMKLGVTCPPAYLEVPVTDIIPHPEYTKFAVGNSIALVKLIRPLQSRYMVPVCMPSLGDRYKKSQTKRVFMVDYISSVPQDFDTERMGKKTMRLYTHKECRIHRLRSKLGAEGVSHMLCTSGCGVRPGAPIVSQNVEGAFELVGLAAGGGTCMRKTSRKRLIRDPPLYIDVYPYYTWLVNVIASHELPTAYPQNFRSLSEGTWIAHTIRPQREFLRKRKNQKVGWKARTFLSGNHCFKNPGIQLRASFFYLEKFEVIGDAKTGLTVHMKLSAGADCTILCARLLLPNRVAEPEIKGVGGYNITVFFSTKSFPYSFTYFLALTGRNSTLRELNKWKEERGIGYW